MTDTGNSSKRPPRIREVYESDLNITELMRAVTRDDPTNLVKILHEPEIIKSLFQTDKKGRTALDWARICRNYNAVTLLMKAMSTAIFNARANSINSMDELEQYIIKTNNLQGIQLREAIKQRDAFLATQILTENTLSREEVEGLGQEYFTDWVGKLGYSPLILASGMNMGDVVRELIRLKVPINHANKFGHTALTIATAAGNADITHYLIFNGADLHHRTEEGRTVLHYACMYGKGKIVKMILDYVLEKFAIFRIQGHSMIDFDYTRWTTYSSILESLINVRNLWIIY